MKRITIVPWLCALCASLALDPTIFAQAPTPYHPTDPISFTVTFDGPSADQMTAIQVNLNLTSKRHDDQPDFSNSFSPNSVEKLGPGRFKVSGTIPLYAASGTYTLQSIYAGPRELGQVFSYSLSGPDAVMFTIENDGHLSKPDLKGVELNPKH
jgi:hypothetical protein